MDYKKELIELCELICKNFIAESRAYEKAQKILDQVESEPKPCPVCGSRAEVEEIFNPHKNFCEFRIRCVNYLCVTQNVCSVTQKDAVKVWNALGGE